MIQFKKGNVEDTVRLKRNTKRGAKAFMLFAKKSGSTEKKLGESMKKLRGTMKKLCGFMKKL